MSAEVRELTPRGRGGVTVLEVRGPGARGLLERLAGPLPDPGRLRLTRLGERGVELEEALVLCEGPERYELHLTGSPPLVRRVASLLGGDSTTPPRSIEARALEALAEVPSEAGARILLDQSRGVLRAAVAAHVEDDPESWDGFARELLEAARVAAPALAPLRVVLAGRVNAGKSTLFNLLVGSERVVVSEEEGTTRDAVVARADLGRWPVVLVDTAGERALDAAAGGAVRLERAGQEVGRVERERADLVIWLDPQGGRDDGVRDGPGLRVLESRADEVAAGRPRSDRSLSALADPQGARRLVARVFREAFELPDCPWSPGRPIPFEEGLHGALSRSLGIDGSEAERRRADVVDLLGPAPA